MRRIMTTLAIIWLASLGVTAAIQMSRQPALALEAVSQRGTP